MSQENSTSNVRTRLWTFIIYPESAPETWRDTLELLSIPFVCSPLHDRDFNPTGEPKKPHYHVFLAFEGVKSYSQVLTVTQSINGTIPQVVHSGRRLIRYFAHLDNPEKAQYSVSDIVSRGVDVDRFLKMTTSEWHSIVDEMLNWCDENHICEYMDLDRYARQNRPEWAEVLSDHSYRVSLYLKSVRHSRNSNLPPGVNPSTGEVL